MTSFLDLSLKESTRASEPVAARQAKRRGSLLEADTAIAPDADALRPAANVRAV